MNLPEFFTSLEEGIFTASINYGRWSNGHRLRLECPLVVNVAEALHGRLGQSESLRLEVPFHEIHEQSEALAPEGQDHNVLQGNRYADIVLFNTDGRPVYTVEVKRLWNLGGCRNDLERLRGLVRACGRQRNGSLRHGILAIFCQWRRGELEQRIENMENEVDGLTNNWEENIFCRAACKTLRDSERRKNTQASNDVRARQLVRF